MIPIKDGIQYYTYNIENNEYDIVHFNNEIQFNEYYYYYSFDNYVETVDGSYYALGFETTKSNDIPNNNREVFIKYDPDGNIAYAVPIADIDSRINVYSTKFCVDANNNIYFFLGHNYDELIIVYSDSLEYLFSINNFLGKSRFNQTDIFSDSEQTVYLCYTERTTPLDSEIRFLRIDPEIKGLRDYSEMPQLLCRIARDANTHMTKGTLGGGEYDAYAYDYTGVYGYKLGEDPVQLFDWLQFGLDINMVKDIYIHSEDEIFVVLYRSEDEYDSYFDRMYDYGRIHKVPISSVYGEGATEEITLTLAIDEENNASYAKILECAASFVRNSGCLVEIVSYSDTEGGFSANQKLVRDIAAGNVPDVVAFGGDITYEQLANIGVFVDLYSQIDNDSEINRSDFLPCVLKPFENKKGELLQLINEFSISTMITKKSVSDEYFNGSSPTCEQLLALNSTLKNNQYLFDVRNISSISEASNKLFSDILPHMLGNFIDYEQKTCNFDGLKDLLRLCKESKLNVINGFSDPNKTMSGDLKILQSTYANAALYLYDRNMYFNSNDISYIGYPSVSYSSASIIPASSFSITKQSNNQEFAWKLIRHFIAIKENSLNNKQNYGTFSYFPCTYRGIDIVFENIGKCIIQMGGDYYRNAGDADDSFSIILSFNESTPEFRAQVGNNIVEVNESDKTALIELFENINTAYISDTIISSIIIEEASYYFSGVKNLDDTIKVITSRVEAKVFE
ncbi:MAG: hypothetical protein HFE63_09110 [Clostridiales bacterium]|nr:hypothetical protein [Clostridiales bacterium]